MIIRSLSTTTTGSHHANPLARSPQEPELAAATKISESNLRAQLAENGASDAEIDILLDERVELNALASDDLVARRS